MLWTNIKRVFRSGFVNFWRNGFVSLSSILVMVITLFVIASIIFVGATLRESLAELQSKLDITVYFSADAPIADITSLQTTIQALPEVQSVQYVSAADALAAFTARHQDDQLVLQSLQELDSNPLTASLVIQAKNPSQYADIVTFLNGNSTLAADGSQVIDNISQNQVAIGKLSKIITASQDVGLGLTILLALISILITFNTIRLTIYISRDEISVMRLVGANARYIRGPFVVIGILYGAIAGLFTLLMFYPITFWLRGVVQSFFVGMDPFAYYLANFGQIFLIIVGSGIVIGAISSYLAVRRYLKV